MVVLCIDMLVLRAFQIVYRFWLELCYLRMYLCICVPVFQCGIVKLSTKKKSFADI